MSRKAIAQKSLLIFVALAAVLAFQNCGIQKPKVENLSFASVGYAHSGNETSCSSCHNPDRPNNSDAFLAPNALAPFDYATHGGALDCISCHLSAGSQAQRSRADWAGGHFKHSPSLVTCQECHSTQRPLVYGNSQPHPTTGDCATCHQNTLSSSFTSLADWQGGGVAPGGIAFDPARDLQLATGVLAFSPTAKTTVQTVSNQTQTLHMSMNHSTSLLSSANLNNCTLCHSKTASADYTGARFHSSLTTAKITQPNSCNDCHSSALPTNFVGPIDSKRSPASPSMKHNAVTWALSAGALAPTTTKLVLNDCKVCHLQSSGSTWSGATYHAALKTAGLGQPSSCLDCHANTRPIGPAGATLFDHAQSGLGDCLSCHTSQTTWAGATGVPATVTYEPPTGSTRGNLTTAHPQMGANVSCVSCHGSSGNYAKAVGFDHSLMPSGTSCVYCHQTGQQNVAAGVTLLTKSNGHQGANLNATDCTSCHSPRYPTKSLTTPATWSGGSW